MLKKIQNLSDGKKKVLIIIVVVLAALALGSIWLLATTDRIWGNNNFLQTVHFPEFKLPALPDAPEGTFPKDTEIVTSKTYTDTQLGFEFSYFSEDLCPGQGGSDAAGNPVLIQLCPPATSGAITVSLKDENIKDGTLQDAYFGAMGNGKVIEVGGKTAYQYPIDQFGCKGYLTAVPLQKNKTVTISLDNCGAGQENDPGFPENGVADLNDILSTFKFTNTTN